MSWAAAIAGLVLARPTLAGEAYRYQLGELDHTWSRATGQLPDRELLVGEVARARWLATAVPAGLQHCPFQSTTGSTAPASCPVRRPNAPRTELLATALLHTVAVEVDGRWRCSGVLVAPDVVLTARHCGGQRMRAAGGLDLADAWWLAEVVDQAAPANPKVDGLLLRLDRALDLGPPVLWRLSEQAQPPSGELLMAGFGTVDLRGSVGYGRLRGVSETVSGWGCDRSTAHRSGCTPGLELVVAGTTTDSCPGDSGGPVFELLVDPEVEATDDPCCTGNDGLRLLLDGRNGYLRSEADLRGPDMAFRWRLVGITSRATASNRQACGGGGIYTRVDALATWILSTLDAWR